MISIVVVNHNRKELLKRCLDSVRGQTFKDIETIVVDNASSDGSIEMLCTYYPEVSLIRNTGNVLFCRAYNQGINASKGTFVLCLNNDTVLENEYLDQMLFAAGLDAKIGMISGKILRMDRRTIDSTGLFLGKNRKPVERGYDKKNVGQYENAGYVFGVSGACAFFKRSMLTDIKDDYGYFDERFGMYYEDLDLCWRAQKKGWRAYYNPKAVVYHMRGGSAIGRKKGKGPNFLYLSYELKERYIRNRYMCIRKNDTVFNYIMNLPFIFLYDIKLWVYKLIRDRHYFFSKNSVCP